MKLNFDTIVVAIMLVAWGLGQLFAADMFAKIAAACLFVFIGRLALSSLAWLFTGR